MSAPLSNRPDVKYGCALEGLMQLPKSNWMESNARNPTDTMKLNAAMPTACR
jgi:hypothetical protein